MPSVSELRKAQDYIKELKKALIHCEEALLANLPHGCDGDEETGQHYEDCLNCLVHGALAHIQEVLK